MGKELITQKIIADAQDECEKIIADATTESENIISLANEKKQEALNEVKLECEKKANALIEGKKATARLDSAKILLLEKRRVIDTIYEQAKKELFAMSKDEAVPFIISLIKKYSTKGDSIAFAKNCPYVEDVLKSSQFIQLNIDVIDKRVDIDGGFMLYGVVADRDVSYTSILLQDRDEHEADIARSLFING